MINTLKNRFHNNMFSKAFFFLTVLFLSTGCKQITVEENIIVVTNNEGLKTAINEASAGDVVTMANGVWQDVQIKFRGQGTAEKPITLKAETTGEVSIEGESYLKFGGEYLIVEGLHFKNGYSPSSAVIDFKISSKDGQDEIANNCKVTNCVLRDATESQQDGIYVPAENYTVVIENCIFFNFARTGVHVQNWNGTNITQNVTVRSCTFWDCWLTLVADAGAIGVWADNPSATINIHVENCIAIHVRTDTYDYTETTADGTVTWTDYTDMATGFGFHNLRTAGRWLLFELYSASLMAANAKLPLVRRERVPPSPVAMKSSFTSARIRSAPGSPLRRATLCLSNWQ